MSVKQVTNEQYDVIFNALQKKEEESIKQEQFRYNQVESLKAIIMKILDEAYSYPRV